MINISDNYKSKGFACTDSLQNIIQTKNRYLNGDLWL